MSDDLRTLEQFLHAKIPLTRAMQLRVVDDEEHCFAIVAPVAANVNHLGTAFGGSIGVIATLAGYSFLWLLLRDRGAEVIVRETTTQFLRPVRESIRAICLRPNDEKIAVFSTSFDRDGRATITLTTRVVENGRTAAEFRGVFVARRQGLSPAA